MCKKVASRARTSWQLCMETTLQSVENDGWWNFLNKMTSRKYEIKKQVIGEDPDLEKSVRTLNRVIDWDRDGITIEADLRHVRETLKRP